MCKSVYGWARVVSLGCTELLKWAGPFNIGRPDTVPTPVLSRAHLVLSSPGNRSKISAKSSAAVTTSSPRCLTGACRRKLGDKHAATTKGSAMCPPRLRRIAATGISVPRAAGKGVGEATSLPPAAAVGIGVASSLHRAAATGVDASTSLPPAAAMGIGAAPSLRQRQRTSPEILPS